MKTVTLKSMAQNHSRIGISKPKGWRGVRGGGYKVEPRLIMAGSGDAV